LGKEPILIHALFRRTVMAKSRDARKDAKKKPAKSAKEKKKAKQEKKKKMG
jgi:hypothetical protein